MGAVSKSPSSITGNEGSRSAPLSTTAQFDLQQICKRIAWSLEEAYKARGTGPEDSPNASWWAEVMLRSVIPLAHSEGGLEIEQIARITQDRLDALRRDLQNQGDPGAREATVAQSPSEAVKEPAPFDLPMLGPSVRIKIKPGGRYLPDPPILRDEMD